MLDRNDWRVQVCLALFGFVVSGLVISILGLLNLVTISVIFLVGASIITFLLALISRLVKFTSFFQLELLTGAFLQTGSAGLAGYFGLVTPSVSTQAYLAFIALMIFAILFLYLVIKKGLIRR